MKAVLVIDIADDVAEAYEDFIIDYDLRGTPKDDDKVIESIRYVEGCPLKPMPEKRESKNIHPFYECYADGWNDCLDYITGETE